MRRLAQSYATPFALLALVSLGACSPERDARPAPSPPVSVSASSSGAALSAVRGAPAAARAAGSARFTFQIVQDRQPTSGRLVGRGVLDFARDVADIEADYSGTASPAPRNARVHVVMAGSQWYVEVPAADRAKVGAPWATAPMSYVGYAVFPISPVAPFVDLLAAASDAVEAGSSEYVVTIPLDAAVDAAPRDLRDGTRDVLREAFGERPLELLVTLDDAGRPTRITTSFERAPGSRLTATSTFSGYGMPVTVAVPPADRTKPYGAVGNAMVDLGH